MGSTDKNGTYRLSQKTKKKRLDVYRSWTVESTTCFYWTLVAAIHWKMAQALAALEPSWPKNDRPNRRMSAIHRRYCCWHYAATNSCPSRQGSWPKTKHRPGWWTDRPRHCGSLAPATAYQEWTPRYLVLPTCRMRQTPRSRASAGRLSRASPATCQVTASWNVKGRWRRGPTPERQSTSRRRPRRPASSSHWKSPSRGRGERRTRPSPVPRWQVHRRRMPRQRSAAAGGDTTALSACEGRRSVAEPWRF